MSAIYKNGSWYGKDAVPEGVTLSQAEFNALPQSEKDNGTVYYIEDGDYLVNKAIMGYTPVGTVISVMGNDAPRHYLACNGQTVNIADYPELANYFEQQFGSKNYFGGDGTITFAVPDLRGEFLRGTGTNSHTDQGSGEDVGTHQDATQHLGETLYVNSSNHNLLKANKYQGVSKFDSIISNSGTSDRVLWSGTVNSGGAFSNGLYTSRPTNTSVLYCIATKNIYTNPENIYSTDEQVIGQWVDGKPLYQRTFTVENISIPKDANPSDITMGTVTNLDILVNAHAVRYITNSGEMIFPGSTSGMQTYFASNKASGELYFIVYRQGSAFTMDKLTATFQYTKTTD